MAGEPRSGQRGFRLGRDQNPEKDNAFFRLANPAVQVLLFTAFMVGLVLLTTRTLTPDPRFDVQEGVPAPRDIKATRTFTYVETDDEATQEKREEAAWAVPKIYDFHLDLQNQKVNNIQRAFAAMRGRLDEALESKRSALLEPDPEPDVGVAKPDVAPPPPIESIKLTPEERVEAAEAVRAEFDQALQTIIDKESFKILARAGFSKSIEEALVGLVHEVMDHHIVPKRRLLEVEGSRGITLRTIAQGEVTRTERRLDFTSFLDTEEVAPELLRISPRHLIRLNEPEVKRAAINVSKAIIETNTEHNEEETAKARDLARAGVAELAHTRTFRKGENIVDNGHIITQQHARIIREMNRNSSNRLPRAQLLIGTIILLIVLLLLMYTFARANITKFRLQSKDLVLLGTVMLSLLLLQQLVAMAFESWGNDWSETYMSLVHYAIPLAVGAMLVRLVLNSETAVVYIILMTLFSGLGAGEPLEFIAYVTAGSLVGANAVGKVNHRMDLLKAGLMVGLVNALMICSVFLLRSELDAWVYLVAVVVGFSSGLMSGVLVSALLPLIEWAFNYTTDIKLLELADLNHPALRELIEQAPGSYHHSVIVGNLCKEAAEAINANPLLARVGAYYHDIGKGKNPQYFAENQRQGRNPHDKLKPNMSALIIKAHVKDGLELARQHNLPREIEDFIAQHHGTTLIAYFYHRAKSLEDPDIPEVDEKDYRYPGPKPQTRETAICLLADGIEAASRAMPDPTPDRLKGLVQKMINKAFADGQLDECDLTLKDLNAIAKAFIRVLMGMYHSRPQYPEDKRRKDDKRAKPQPSGAQQRPQRTTSANLQKAANGSEPALRARPRKNSRSRRGGQTVFEDRLGDNNPEVLALNTPKRTVEMKLTREQRDEITTRKRPQDKKERLDAPDAEEDRVEVVAIDDEEDRVEEVAIDDEEDDAERPPSEEAHAANGAEPHPTDTDEPAEGEDTDDAAGADPGEPGGDDLGGGAQQQPPDEPDDQPLRRLGLS
ncbi:MAG: hypothetical protein CMH57_15225 [Myxococcales bacterium]|nr:hypothetical protein [Myxococcales bacterium]